MLTTPAAVTGPRSPASPPPGSPVTGFGAFVAEASRRGTLVVQPRMGFADPAKMRAGLLATRRVAGTTVGTVTIDSYTRTGDHLAATRAVLAGIELNGYPLVAHGPEATRAMTSGVHDRAFPIQVRHGSAAPLDIVDAAVAAGLTATEGGPVSYCLPYSRLPLRAAVANWAATCRRLAAARDAAAEPHLESFGGCMLGQLCPPGLLVALSVLECMFFRQHGIRSVSLSYAQQTHPGQDRDALLALRRLAGELLAGLDWHVVVYTYMGVFPRTPAGAERLLAASVELATAARAERLIVKTVAEAHRIPTIEENVGALELAAAASRRAADRGGPAAGVDAATAGDNEVYAEARAIVDAVLDLDGDLGAALVAAFERGLLDVPYCLHDDNRGEARSYIDAEGRLRWARVGALPLPRATRVAPVPRLSSTDLLAALRYVERAYDSPPSGEEVR